MKLSEALHDVTLLGIDTMPFIYLVERNPAYLDRVRALFQRVDRGNWKRLYR